MNKMDNSLKNRLKRNFFNRDTLTVAQELLGKTFVFGKHQGIITETEAYMGFQDPASHAYRGKTNRTEVMFGKAGFSYVYFIYGMYHCLNFVTERVGFPAAVLIRGVQLILPPNPILLNGPGKLCRHFGITRAQSGIDIITSNEMYVSSFSVLDNIEYTTTPRIGISKAQDKLWRYVLKMPKAYNEISIAPPDAFPERNLK